MARDLGAGGALAGELDLAREYGTSRVTVRRALDLLRQEGLVTSRRGAGWFAARRPGPPAARARHHGGGRGRSRRRPARAARSSDSVSSRRRRRSPTRSRVDPGADVLRVERVNLADDEPFALVTVWVRADLGADVSRADVERATFYDLLPLRGVELGCGAPDDHRRDRKRRRGAPPRVRARVHPCCSVGASPSTRPASPRSFPSIAIPPTEPHSRSSSR